MGPRDNCRFLCTAAKKQQRCLDRPSVSKAFRSGSLASGLRFGGRSPRQLLGALHVRRPLGVSDGLVGEVSDVAVEGLAVDRGT